MELLGVRVPGPVSTVSRLTRGVAGLALTAAAGGHRDRTVLAAGLGSAILLTAIIQTPGIIQFFGCTPLGPVAWTMALSSAASASLVARPSLG